MRSQRGEGGGRSRGGNRGGRGGNRGSRVPSGPWSRLKPVELDPLDSIGLPSKGDTRLLDFKTQEQYYQKIVERYMTFCSDAGERDELLRRFSSLDLQSAPTAPLSSHTATASTSQLPNTKAYPSSTPVDPANQKKLSDVLMALRKLREGIVASKRTDDFATQAYLFNIRLSVLTKQPESYHAAILHILRHIHPAHPLNSVELQEVVSYLILDTACRRNDLAEAYLLRKRYNLRDGKVNNVLAALAHDNYIALRRVKRSVDGHRARLIDFAEDDMRKHALKCFGRTYLAVEKGYLEWCAQATWNELVERDNVGWELDGDKVVVRKIKAR